jgi:hypothetical protein
VVAERGTPIPTPSQAFAAFSYVRPNSRVYGIALRAGVSRHWRNVTKSNRNELRERAKVQSQLERESTRVSHVASLPAFGESGEGFQSRAETGLMILASYFCGYVWQ